MEVVEWDLVPDLATAPKLTTRNDVRKGQFRGDSSTTNRLLVRRRESI
jgi:hypothetical protein